MRDMKALVAFALVGCIGCGVHVGPADDDTGDTADAAPDTELPDAGAPEPDARATSPDASPFVPEPIPAVDEEPAPACPDTTPAGYFQFLDDTCSARRVPSVVDRDQACPNAHTDATGYAASDEPIVVDTEALAGVVPPELQVTLILVRRIDGVPHYRYYSNGRHDAAYQPWSTTKWLAAANAAASLRIASDYAVGLTASVDGMPLGDLVTSIHNYDASPYTSNSLGRYFHNIGGRGRANDLIHGLWLGRPATETFGGNYGEGAPPLGYTFADDGASVTVTPDSTSGPANHLSGFAIADALRRIVLHREEASWRLPGIQWADIRVLLYGAEGSAAYGDWGGMTADSAIYLQQAHDLDYIERRSHGRWRVFSKLGLGSGGQFLDVGYACLPVLDDAGNPVPDWGRELIIATHLPAGGASWAARDRMLARAYRAIVTRVVDGRL